MESLTLFEKKEDCCACGACLNICHKQAITMEEDECGFLYPKIDEDICINCGACTRVCAFQNTEEYNSPIRCYAAVSRDKDQVKLSASGGIFSALATKTINDGGVVFGAAFKDDWTVKHCTADSISKLKALQGSKYVQSDTGKTFSEVKEYLKEGRKVLYSGTPCQIAGLKEYLGKDYDNLLTIDIVCHGVPSNKMFKEYIKILEEKHGGKLTSFSFRDKSFGWGKFSSAVIKSKKISLWESDSSYLYYFANASSFRENCYKCKYAGEHRPGDLTIGDYWGIDIQHPEYIGRKGWNASEGISLIVVNTNKGLSELKSTESYIDYKESDFEMIALGNAQLQRPSVSLNRDEVLDLYIDGGWEAVDKRFNNSIGLHRYSSQLKALLPKKIKRVLKGIPINTMALFKKF